MRNADMVVSEQETFRDLGFSGVMVRGSWLRGICACASPMNVR